MSLFSKARAVLAMKRLDAAAKRENITREESLHGTLRWLFQAQDAEYQGEVDDGVSYGYSVYDGWVISYPETTGYILQTLMCYYDQFGKDEQGQENALGAEIMERGRRMAHWEVDIQMTNGATPGDYVQAKRVPVAFNTGQVLMGWAEWLRHHPDDTRVHDAAVKAGNWLVACLEGTHWFAGGVSSEAEHGNLSYNSMVSWGLAELALVLDNKVFADAALTTARHYASLTNDTPWLEMAGFTEADARFPLTHTLGYSIQGFIEVGQLLVAQDLILKGKDLLNAARKVIDSDTGFLPGRVQPNWSGGAHWACLTGSSQFAYSYLRLEQLGYAEPDYLDIATALVDFVVGTQVTTKTSAPQEAYGVRGSYPFAMKGYDIATYPNWAAKFLMDAEICLHKLGKL